jgi:hypothetical protein
MVDSKVNEFWFKRMVEDKSSKSSLAVFRLFLILIVNSQLLWSISLEATGVVLVIFSEIG